MKRFSLLLALALAAALAAVSCDKDSSTSSTSLTVGRGSFAIPYEGGTYAVKYTVSNPVDDGAVRVHCDSSWVYDFDFSIEDTLQFTVGLQEERVARSAVMSLSYVSGSDTLSTAMVVINQSYNNYYGFEASCAGGYYYGVSNIYNNEGNLQFSLYLSDTPLGEDGSLAAGGEYYILDLWSNEEPEGYTYVSLPEGEYSYGKVGENWTLSEDSRYIVVNGEGDDYDLDLSIVDGTLTVTRSGDVTEITADIEDSDGGLHSLSFSGECLLEDVSLVSTLDGDLDFGDFSDVGCEARYYGDYYNSGTSNWVLNIYPEDGSGFTVDLGADSSYSLETGIPEGSFTCSHTGGEAGTFLYGSIYNGYLSGTWFVTMQDGLLAEPYAPIGEGEITIAASGDGYTVTFDVLDDRGNRITGTWTGMPELADYTTSPSSASPRAGKSGIGVLSGGIRLSR